MLHEAIERIMAEYPTARNEAFSNHPLNDFITTQIPNYLSKSMNVPNIIWKSSAGKGQWADAPWIAALNRIVTATPMQGYYPVYIFSRSLDTVYLFLNQGMTALAAEYGITAARAIMLERAKILRARNPEFRKAFTEDPIFLQATSPTSRLAMYEVGHVFGKKYSRDRIPSTHHLLNDLSQMLSLYTKSIYRGGFSDVETAELFSGEEKLTHVEMEQQVEEIKKYRFHRLVERNKTLSNQAKHVHGYRCEVCGFDFYAVYGEIGKNFIEAHHRQPLSTLSENQSVTLSPKEDFAVLCANCHRMVHRRGAPKTFDEFKHQYAYLQNKKRFP